MKKRYAILLTLALVGTIFAEAYKPSSPTFVTPRYSAIGGYHTTDTMDYFTIFANPAGIPLAGKKAVWPGLYMNFGGPLDQTFDLIKNFIKGNDIMSELPLLVGSNGVNSSIELIGPITLGTLGKNFGWGLFNKVYASAIIPTISNMTALGGVDLLLQFSYGLPLINTDKHFLSVGISAKGIAKLQGLYSGTPATLFSNFSKIADILPLYSALGFGFDAGILYRFNNILSIGVTWNDFYTPMWTQQYKISTLSSFGSKPSGYVVAASKLNAGIGIRIPMGKADKVLTSWNIMIDYNDFLSLFMLDKPSTRNPLLNLTAGTELVLLKFIALRVGISDMYLNAGAGLKLGVVRIDFAAYGKELGLEPGSIPQMNMAFSIGVNY